MATHCLQHESIAVEVGFENANPQHSESIAVDAEGVFTVKQDIEVDAPVGYSFHLHVALVNCSPTPRVVCLKIHWAEDRYDDLRDHIYVGYDSGARWRMLSARSNCGIAAVEVVIPPGRHLLCASPKFDYGDARALFERTAGRSPIEVVGIGDSAEGREMVGLRCGRPGARKVLITTRAHGYETAGAYAVAGWLDGLLSAPESREPLLDRLDVHFLPMINPDAVASGNGCLAPSGVNFGDGLATGGSRDAGAQRIVEFVLRLRPDVYVDMHNYMHSPLVDAFRTPDTSLIDRFAAVAPDCSRSQKVWSFQERTFAEGYLMTVCNRRFGTIPVLTEFPWYTRLPQDMRADGSAFLDAFLSVVADDHSVSKV